MLLWNKMKQKQQTMQVECESYSKKQKCTSVLVRSSQWMRIAIMMISTKLLLPLITCLLCHASQLNIDCNSDSKLLTTRNEGRHCLIYNCYTTNDSFHLVIRNEWWLSHRSCFWGLISHEHSSEILLSLAQVYQISATGEWDFAYICMVEHASYNIYPPWRAFSFSWSTIWSCSRYRWYAYWVVVSQRDQVHWELCKLKATTLSSITQDPADFHQEGVRLRLNFFSLPRARLPWRCSNRLDAYSNHAVSMKV